MHAAVAKTFKTDRERLLAQLVRDLSYAATKYQHQNFERSWGHVASEEPVIGDLVIGACGAIGYLVAKVRTGSDGWVIQLLGTDTRETWNNESFKPVRGIRTTEYFVGAQYQFSLKVRKVDGDGDFYSYRPTVTGFDGDTAIVNFRIRWEQDSYDIRVPKFKAYKTIKAVRAELQSLLNAAKITPGNPIYDCVQAELAHQAKIAAEQAAKQPQTTETIPS